MRNIKHHSKRLMDLMLTKTAINTYVVFFGNGLSAFFAFLFFLISFRTMRIEDFGYFSAMLSFLLLVSDLADVGIGSSLSAFLPPLEINLNSLYSFLKTAFLLQIGIAVLLSCVLFILSQFLSNILFHNLNLAWFVRIWILGIFCTIIANFFQYTLSARQKFYQVGFLSAFSSILRVVFIGVLIEFSFVNLFSISWLHVFTFVFTGIAAFLFIKPAFLKAIRIREDLRKLVKFTSFLAISRGLTSLASRLDVLMLISLAGPKEAGIYSIASRVISIYPLLAGSFSMVVAPKMSTIGNKEHLKKFISKVIFGTIGIIASVVFLIIIGKPFMITLFSQKAAPAVPAFKLLLVSMVFFVASIPIVSMTIYYLRKPQILSVNSVIQLLIVVIGNLYFIPKFGTLGPAISLILSYGVTLFTTLGFSLYYLRKKHEV